MRKNFTVHIAHNNSLEKPLYWIGSGSPFIKKIAYIHNHNQKHRVEYWMKSLVVYECLLTRLAETGL
jgi:hypothetical protein